MYIYIYVYRFPIPYFSCIYIYTCILSHTCIYLRVYIYTYICLSSFNNWVCWLFVVLLCVCFCLYLQMHAHLHTFECTICLCIHLDTTIITFPSFTSMYNLFCILRLLNLQKGYKEGHSNKSKLMKFGAHNTPLLKLFMHICVCICTYVCVYIYIYVLYIYIYSKNLMQSLVLWVNYLWYMYLLVE